MSENRLKQVPNFYPEFAPVPYEKRAIDEADVVAVISALNYQNIEIKRAAYSISCNETGGFKSFINTNGSGAQADQARWSKRWDSAINGTTVKEENMTGTARRFLVFKTWQQSITMLTWYVNDRGMYIGGNGAGWANINPVKPGREVQGELLQVDLFTAYLRAWVTGDEKAKPKLADMRDFTAIYNKATKIFV